MPDLKSIPQPVPLKIDYPCTQVEITKGAYLFLQYCMPCHGEIDNKFGVLPELGHVTKAKFDLLNDIVRKGTLEQLGMPNFGSKLTDEDIENLKKYIVAKAKKIY